MRKIVSFTERVTRAAGGFAAWLLVPLVAIVVYAVITRYVFNAPAFWGYEISYMLTGAIFILGNAYALQKGRHIRIDFLYSSFGPKLQAVANLFGYLCIFLPMAWWTTWGLGDYALQAFHEGRTSGRSAWDPVIWPFRVILCIGFGLLALQATVEMIRAVAKLIGKEIPENNG